MAVKDTLTTKVNGVDTDLYPYTKDECILDDSNTPLTTRLSDIKSDIAELQDVSLDWSKYFRLMADDKVYETVFYKSTTSTSSTGEKLQDNAGLVCEASTDTVKGRDDYETEFLFRHWDVNAYVDNNGFQHVTAVEGDSDFDRYNKNVYVMYPTWYIKKTEYETKWGIAITSKPTEGFVPLSVAVQPDGTVSPYMLFCKYNADDDWVCASGRYPQRFISYNKMIDTMQKHANGGKQYSYMTTGDLLFIQLLFMLKYATINSQSIMVGCTNYYLQYKCAVGENNTSRVILTTANANNLVVGSTVQIGVINGTSTDRVNTSMCSIAKNVQIKAIKAIDGTNSEITFVEDVSFTTTTETYVSTIHWKTGSTDCVKGSDGSPVNNTNGKYPCKIGGIEFMMGGYEILNMVEINEVVGDQSHYTCYSTNDSRNATKSVTADSADYYIIGEFTGYPSRWNYILDEEIDLDAGFMYPTTFGGSSSVGFADGIYLHANAGTYMWRAFGDLHNGADAGAWFGDLYYSLSFASWNYLARLSASGVRG